MTIRTVSVPSADLPRVVFEWLAELRRSGIGIAVIEGLPGAGKTTLLSKLKSEFVSWYVVELDDFLRQPEDQSRAWADLVLERGAGAAVGKWSAEGPTLIEGVAAWPVVRCWMAEQAAAPRIARAYLKQVTRHGGVTFWDHGEGLVEHARRHQPFFASVYDYHAREQPWLTADLVFERIANGDDETGWQQS